MIDKRIIATLRMDRTVYFPTKENPMPNVIHHPHPAHAHNHTMLYIGIALLVMVAVILAISLLPSIMVRTPVVAPAAANLEYPDYALRHPELSLPMPAAPVDTTDYYFRHPELVNP